MLDQQSSKEIEAFVKNARKQGTKDESIRKEFQKRGYPGYIIDYYLQKRNHVFAKAMVIVIAITAIALIAYFILPKGLLPSPLESCADKTCFIQKAESCAPAKFLQDEKGTLVQYTTKQCVLTKKIIKVSSQESAHIREAVAGKSMTCSYQQGYFNANWINTMTIDIQHCEGQLKDAIQSLLNS